MRIRIVHETHYRYQRPVKALTQILRLTPRDHDGQHVRNWRIEPSVDGRLRQREDPFGNIVHVFSADAPVDSMRVSVGGDVETHDTSGVIRGTIERLPDLFYLRETALTMPDEAIRDFANAAAVRVAADPLAGLHQLLQVLHREVAFDTEPTHVATTAAEAFSLKRGVCQDLTHILIAAARSLGVPARYVSGYLRRSDQVEEQEAGHAWAEAKVRGLGWVGFDAANGISVSEGHVRVAVGLDYLGAAPIRGSRHGGGSEELEVRLNVHEAQLQSQA
ncbi:MAG TPA: transglutaminase family protein [Beijerinckiaceae bacterium]|jgi:transglutaminase-like putative cysteine protease